MFKKKSYLGIDVGASAIKIVEFRKAGKSAEFVQSHVTPVSREVVMNLHRDFAPVAASIHESLATMGIQNAEAIIALPNQFTFSRFIKLPPVISSKIGQIIEYEAQQQVPFPIDSVVWDYQVLNPGGVSLETEVTLCAIEKHILDGFLTALKKEPSVEAIDVGSLALYNVVNRARTSQGVVYIDIGATTTTLLIYEGSKFWSRNLPLAGNEITETIKSELHVDFAEAEEVKVRQGMTEDGSNVNERVKHCVTLTLQRLIAEVQRSIGYYRSQSQDVTIEKIVISGGGANLKGIAPFIEKSVGIKTEIIDLLQNIPHSVKAPTTLPPSFAIACGLGLRAVGKVDLTINLLPEDVLREKHFKHRQWRFYGSVLLFWLSLAVLYFGLHYRTDKLLTKMKDLNASVAEYSQWASERKKYDAQIIPVESQLEDLRSLMDSKHLWLEIWKHISETMPEDFWLHELMPVQSKEQHAPLFETAHVPSSQRPSDRGGRRNTGSQRALSQGGDNVSASAFYFYRNIIVRGVTTGNYVDVDQFKEKLLENGFVTSVDVLSAVERDNAPGIAFEIYIEVGDTL